MLERLSRWDEALLLLINGSGAPWIDPLMIFLSEKWVWVPLYLFIIYALIRKYDMAWIWPVLGLLLVILIADQVTSSLMKPYIERLRPCRNPLIAEWVRLVDRCGGQYGFASSHAANTMGLAILSRMLLQVRWTWLLILWSAVIGYSRIYLGVHYPGDVLAGFAVGGFAAAAVYWLLRRLSGLLGLANRPSQAP